MNGQPVALEDPWYVSLLPLGALAWFLGWAIYFTVALVKLGAPLWRRLAPALPVLVVAGAMAGLAWRVG